MDGGSTDQTLKILKKFTSKYPNKISVESKKDEGQAAAVNSGIKKSSGDVVAYINADDYYLGEVFSKIAKVYKAAVNWYVGDGVVVSQEGVEIFKFVSFYKKILKKINSYKLLLVVNYIVQPSVFLSRRAYDEFGPFSGSKKFITEYEMWLKLGKIGMPNLIDEDVSAFRMYPQTITGSSSAILLQEDERIVKKYTKNKIYIFLHRLNNLARKIVQSL